MTKIKIPFNKWSRKKLKEGKKTTTARTKRYGEEGDWFEVDGVKYELWGIGETILRDVINYRFKDEGAESPEELRRVFRQIFRTKELGMNRIMYVHYFRKMEVAEK